MHSLKYYSLEELQKQPSQKLWIKHGLGSYKEDQEWHINHFQPN